MDISRQDLVRQYQKLSNAELLDIYARRGEYTPMAVEVLVDEMRSRGLSGERVEDEPDGPTIETGEPEKPLATGGLRFIEKMVAYILSPLVLVALIFLSFLLDDSSRETNQRKISQAFFFVLSSLGIMVVFALLDNASIVRWHTEFWVAAFLIPFLISVRPKRERFEEILLEDPQDSEVP